MCFFFKQKTAYEMRISDWSSDVCSSDLLGLFELSHMQYEHDRDRGPEGEPDLEAMTRFAIESLSRNPDGYVLLVEGARIDHANHDGNAYRALDETTSLSRAVQAAVDMTSADDTLIVVTADHSHEIGRAQV